MPLTDAEVLARCPLLAELAEADIHALAAASRRRDLAGGESLFLAGEHSQGLAVVVTGRIKVDVNSQLLIIEQSGFQRVLRERPEVALHLMGMLGRRLRRLVNLVEQISFQEVVHRLARYLLKEAEAGVPFHLDTNGAIAAQLGTVPELVSRNLSRLHTGGIINLSGRSVKDLDRQQLYEMAHSAGR